MWEVYLWDMLLFGMQNTNKFKELGEVKWNLFQLCDGDDVSVDLLCWEVCGGVIRCWIPWDYKKDFNFGYFPPYSSIVWLVLFWNMLILKLWML